MNRELKRAAGRCGTKFCRGVIRGTNWLCSRCMMRKWRAAKPMRAAFAHLRESAQRRGIPFLLTVEEFEGFCARTGYLERKGTEAEDLHLDRIDHRRGYELDNIQVLPMRENSRKGSFERWHGHGHGTATGAVFFPTATGGTL